MPAPTATDSSCSASHEEVLSDLPSGAKTCSAGKEPSQLTDCGRSLHLLNRSNFLWVGSHSSLVDYLSTELNAVRIDLALVLPSVTPALVNRDKTARSLSSCSVCVFLHTKMSSTGHTTPGMSPKISLMRR